MSTLDSDNEHVTLPLIYRVMTSGIYSHDNDLAMSRSVCVCVCVSKRQISRRHVIDLMLLSMGWLVGWGRAVDN